MFSLFLLVAVASFFTEQNEAGQTAVLTFQVNDICFLSDGVAPRDCQEWLSMNATLRDGKYRVCPTGLDSDWAVHAQCDMKGGGWTIVLKRFDGSVDFNLNWYQMEVSSGSGRGEYWLGLEDLHRFTKSGDYSLMVEIRKKSRTWTEVYDSFTLSDQAQMYSFRADGFDWANSNNTEPVLAWYNNRPFSARFRDKYACAENGEGPGWFKPTCDSYIHPFGPYTPSQPDGLQRMKWRVEGGNIYPTGLIIKIKRRS